MRCLHILIFFLLLTTTLRAQEELAASAPRDAVSTLAIITVHGDIDFGLQKSVDRRIGEAIAAGAQVLVFHMDTYGGMLDAGTEIADSILAAAADSNGQILTVAYVDPKAISAGALISLACNQIIMHEGATLGDCQAIMIDPQTRSFEPAPEKIQTNVRALMRKYAQANGYPVALCEAMVDPEFEVFEVTMPDGAKQFFTAQQFAELPGDMREAAEKRVIVPRGQLLTMTSKEALEYGFSSATVSNREEAIDRYASADAKTLVFETNWSEEMVRFLNSMAVSGLLMTVGIVALYIAFKMPGFGVPEMVAISCFAVIFLSKFLIGLATEMEVLIFAVGVGLLAVEIFLIPGFGLVGIAGIVCVFISLVLAFQNFVIPTTNFETNILIRNLVVIFGSMAGATLIFMIAIRFMPKAPFLHKLVLSHTQQVEAGYVVGSANARNLKGREGVALSTLRPSGRAEIEGEHLLVVTEGEFLEPGTPIVVMEVSGNRIIVRQKEA